MVSLYADWPVFGDAYCQWLVGKSVEKGTEAIPKHLGRESNSTLR